jgi:hypothetical protein
MALLFRLPRRPTLLLPLKDSSIAVSERVIVVFLFLFIVRRWSRTR